MDLEAECKAANTPSGPETPADGAPYISFMTDGKFKPSVTEVPPERKFNSADLFAFRRVRGDIVLSILILAMALFLTASFAVETGWAKRKLPTDMGQYIGIQFGLLDAEGRVARLGVIDRLAPGRPEFLDGIEHVRAERHTPPTLTRALDRLEKHRHLIEALNPLLVEAFLVLKRDEAKRLKNGHIDQIRDYYLPFL